MIALHRLCEVGLWKAECGVCIAGISLSSGWSLALSLYHPQVAKGYCTYFWRPQGKASLSWWGINLRKLQSSRQNCFETLGAHWIQTEDALDTNTVGCQNVKSGSDLPFNQIPGLDCVNSVKPVVKGYSQPIGIFSFWSSHIFKKTDFFSVVAKLL